MWIFGGVCYYQWFVGQDGVVVEGQVVWCLFGIQVDMGFELLVVVVDQIDQYGFYFEGFLCQFYQGVQVVFGGGVDQCYVVQGLLVQGFVGREGVGVYIGF